MIIFLHNQKAGGTTMHDVLRQVYGHKTHLSVDAVREELAKGERLGAAGAHWHYGVHREIGIEDSKAQYITILREPLPRLVSCYYFAANRPDAHHPGNRDLKVLIDHGLTLAGFLTWWVRGAGWANEQTQRLSAIPGEEFWSNRAHSLELARHNLESCAAVGTLERLDEFVELCRYRFDWPEVELPRLNHATPEVPPDLPGWVCEVVAEQNAEDMALHGQANRLLTEALTAEREKRGATCAI